MDACRPVPGAKSSFANSNEALVQVPARVHYGSLVRVGLSHRVQ
jgi:hypothetical protein